MKKALAILLAAVMCAAFLTACGNSNAAGSSAQSDNKQSAAGTDSQVLVVGTNAEFPPFEYIGDDGEPDGFDIALIKAIGEKLGMEVEVQNMEFDSLVTAIGSKIDVAIAGMTIREDRLAVVDFSDPYYDAVQYVIVAADSEIASAADLENKAIGAQLGTTGNFIAEEISGATIQTYNKALDAVNDLINGRVEAVIVDKNPALVFAQKYPDKVKALDGADFGFEPEQYAIALPKGGELTAKVNQALVDLKADGTFDALVAKYIGEEE